MEFDWLDILEKVFEILIFPALSAAALYFITWIRAKKIELQQKTKNEITKKYLDMLDVTITECVLATNQTYVDALKKEGSFDAEAQKKAFQLTFDAVMGILTDEAQKYIGETVKDLGAYITNKIEAHVSAVKSKP
jgi:hypothetical protein